jgi:hypothetical protein
MRSILSAFMILIFLSPILVKVGIFVDFKVHQDFIAKVLCINKDKPMSNCNGKCILAQKLKKAEEPQKKEFPAALKERFEINLYLSDILKVNPGIHLESDNKTNSPQNDPFLKFNFSTEIFHPPKG